jgi:Raf kinase inhibitor-like YbhB/YbcL family protein
MDAEVLELTIYTPAFQPGGMIDPKYTCDGNRVNPPLQINNIPEGTQSLALIVEDPDAPSGTYDHWVVWNIEPTSQIEEKSNPGTSGNNSAGRTGYYPPCPPSGTHRYYFHVFAVDTMLDLSQGESKTKLQQAMKGHILAKGTIMGKYQRHKA